MLNNLPNIFKFFLQNCYNSSLLNIKIIFKTNHWRDMSFSFWKEPSLTKVSDDEEKLFFFFIKRARVQVHSQWHDMELGSPWCQIFEKGIWRSPATYQFLFFLFLAIPVYLLASGLCYYSVSHKINGIKPHNKMSLETSVPMSHKTGFIFTFQFNNMKI